MKPGGIIDTVVSRLVGTPLYWPVKEVRRRLDHLAEARERWAERPLSLRLRAIIVRFSALIVRASASGVEPGIKNLRRMPPDLDIPDYERQIASYSAVMAGFRFWAVTTKDRFTWSNPLVLQSILEAAGIAASPSDERTRQQALSRSRPQLGDLPEIMFNPRSIAIGTLNHELSHELFHAASPLGGGLCLDGHAREILANRFAVEMTHPVPGVVYSAEADAARTLDSPFAFEEVMRISSRRMFAITIPVDGDGNKGSIVLQESGSLTSWGNPDLARLTPSWDDLVLWSKPGVVDYYPPNVSWKPELIPTGAHGFVNLQTIDGLYYVMPSTDDVWSMFTESGIVGLADFSGLAPGLASFDARDIPEIATEDHHVVIEGGQYLVLHMLRNVVSFPQYLSHEMHQLFAIRDEDGYLFQAWEQAAGGRKPSWGPLLPPLDSQLHEHLAPFDNWWRANSAWKEITFNLWAAMMSNRFMRDLTADEKREKQTWEAEKIEDMRNGQYEPGFVARPAQN